VKDRRISGGEVSMNKQIVAGIYEAFGRGDLAAVLGAR
jgi:hypothetical protein